MAKSKFNLNSDAVDDIRPVVEEIKPSVNALNAPISTSKKTGYINLNIKGYSEFIGQMSKAKGISKTEYIRSLIEADYLKYGDKIAEINKLLGEIK